MHGAPLEVIIIGGGFGGLAAARELARHPVHITLLDRKNHHTFQPLLYQVATAGLSPGDIAAPIRHILRKHQNVKVILGEAIGFDLEARRVMLREVALPYDYLIVAAGAAHSYFNHPEWEALAPGLKTIEDALEIRRRVLLAFEVAERQAALTGRHEPLNFVVVGGGPTGVELAGTLAEVARQSLAHDFRAIDPTRTRILLVEAGPRVLAQYAEDLSRSAEEQLRGLGVDVQTHAMVTGVEPGGIRIGDTFMPAAVTLWAAGVAASPLGRLLGAKTDRAGRVLVEPDLSIAGHPEVFVIGDLAAAFDSEGRPLPGVAPVAIQQGKWVARIIGQEPKAGVPAGTTTQRKPFYYRDRGILATIGRAAAVAQFPHLHISGFIAWIAWLFIHIFFLIGFRNRVMVMLQWAWWYFTYERGARLITETSPPFSVPRSG